MSFIVVARVLDDGNRLSKQIILKDDISARTCVRVYNVKRTTLRY